MARNYMTTCAVLCAAVLVGVIIYYCMYMQREGFTNLSAGSIDNVGALLDDSYDILSAPEMNAPAPNFADLAEEGDHLKEYFQHEDKSGDDLHMVNTPRVSTALKSKYKDYSLSNMIRGDLAITYQPNVCLVAKTRQGRDDLRLDGLFTPHFVHLYNKYTGQAYKNLPTYVAGAGQACGYGGSSGGVIMDNY
jgi:hypothetical protein